MILINLDKDPKVHYLDDLKDPRNRKIGRSEYGELSENDLQEIATRTAEMINHTYVKLDESRGLETPMHKNFMRCTVLMSDLIMFIPAVIAFGRAAHIGGSGDHAANKKSLVTISLLVFYPGLILIDNGHFQVNI